MANKLFAVFGIVLLLQAFPEAFTSTDDGDYSGEKAVYSAKLTENLSPICLLPSDFGDCLDADNAVNRYFFYAERGTCELFIWSGCGGNENRFTTLPDCKAKCNVSNEFPAITAHFQFLLNGAKDEFSGLSNKNFNDSNSFNVTGQRNIRPDMKDESYVAAAAAVVASYFPEGNFGYAPISGNCLGQIIRTTLLKSLLECATECDNAREPACSGFLYHDGNDTGFSICQLTAKCAPTNVRVADGVFYLRKLQ